VLHLATHGFVLDPSRPDASGVPSGSALDQGTERDDGILTGEEIVSLDLSSVDWAVLSACETGLGEARAGERIFGLRRAFRLAGASTLIHSLWPVEDGATLEWMTLLYEKRLRSRLETATAVRDATRDLLARRRQAGLSIHPFYWGGFVASGDWR
jgi:CHAT domain-containing protein